MISEIKWYTYIAVERAALGKKEIHKMSGSCICYMLFNFSETIVLKT